MIGVRIGDDQRVGVRNLAGGRVRRFGSQARHEERPPFLSAEQTVEPRRRLLRGRCRRQGGRSGCRRSCRGWRCRRGRRGRCRRWRRAAEPSERVAQDHQNEHDCDDDVDVALFHCPTPHLARQHDHRPKPACCLPRSSAGAEIGAARRPSLGPRRAAPQPTITQSLPLSRSREAQHGARAAVLRDPASGGEQGWRAPGRHGEGQGRQRGLHGLLGVASPTRDKPFARSPFVSHATVSFVECFRSGDHIVQRGEGGRFGYRSVIWFPPKSPTR